MDGTGFKIWQAIRSRGTLAVHEVEFTEIKFNESGPHYAGTAIVVLGGDPALDLRLTKSKLSEIGRNHVFVFGAGTDAVIKGNSSTGKGDGDFLDYAIELGGGGTATISGNEIRGNRGVASTDGSTSAGILVTTFFGPGSGGTISDNTFERNTTGVAVGFNLADTSVVTIESNEFARNRQAITILGDGSTVTDNEIEDSGGDAIHVDGDGNTVTDNEIEDSGGDGIQVDGDGNLVTDNEIEDSGGFDCRDTSVGGGTAGTANTWTDNDGDTSSPAGLCGGDDDDDD